MAPSAAASRGGGGQWPPFKSAAGSSQEKPDRKGDPETAEIPVFRPFGRWLPLFEPVGTGISSQTNKRSPEKPKRISRDFPHARRSRHRPDRPRSLCLAPD